MASSVLENVNGTQPRVNGRSAPKKPADPAQAANQRILAEREERIRAKETEEALANDLGLNIKEKAPDPADYDSAAEFLRDEFDRKSFGDQITTYTRVLYGPDPLLTSCPHLKARIEDIGLEEYARCTAEAIMLQEERALPDPVLRKGLRGAIARFGVEAVASAFAERILKIPSRTVEIEADRSDPLILSRPLEEAVERYGTPGMAAKFLSDRCIGVLGLRGYQIVKDEKGDPVKVGTLIMGEIPVRMAERRRDHYAALSDQAVSEAAETFEDNAARAIRDSKGGGISVLGRGERVHANAAGDLESEAETASYLGRVRETGFRVERQQ